MVLFFFFNDTATTEIYTLSLHDALPISRHGDAHRSRPPVRSTRKAAMDLLDSAQGMPTWLSVLLIAALDRKSTRLNSSHANISYAVFCLKKKKNIKTNISSSTL